MVDFWHENHDSWDKDAKQRKLEVPEYWAKGSVRAYYPNPYDSLDLWRIPKLGLNHLKAFNVTPLVVDASITQEKKTTKFEKKHIPMYLGFTMII